MLLPAEPDEDLDTPTFSLGVWSATWRLMETRRGRSPCESCDPEEPEQAADVTAHTVLLLLRREREEFCINMCYLSVSMALLHQTMLLVRHVASPCPTVGTHVHVLTESGWS